MNSPKAVTHINTRLEVAKLAGLSDATIKEVKKVKEVGTDEIKKQMLSGKITVHKAYTETFQTKEDKKCITCGQVKPHTEFYGTKHECKECQSFKRRHGYDNDVVSKVMQLSKVNTDAMLEDMAKKEPSEEGIGQDSDNLIIHEIDKIIKAFRADINRFLYMSSAFSEVSLENPVMKELAKAKEELEKIMNYAKENKQ